MNDTPDTGTPHLVGARGTRENGDMRVRLIRKLADALDGIDVSRYRDGDVIDLPCAQAELLLAEGWVCRIERRQPSTRAIRTIALDAPLRLRTVEQLRRIRAQMEAHRLAQLERRRIEDRIREELRDARARIVGPAADQEPS